MFAGMSSAYFGSFTYISTVQPTQACSLFVLGSSPVQFPVILIWDLLGSREKQSQAQLVYMLCAE